MNILIILALASILLISCNQMTENISKEEWNRIEAPLLEIDDILKDFSSRNNLELSTNYHNWPERSLTWNDCGIRKLIQIYLENNKSMTFNFWLCASIDKDGKRYWKHIILKKNVPFEEIKINLNNLLLEGLNTLNSWQESNLEPTKT